MFDLNTIKVDPKLASEGKWCEFLGGEFLIARWNNRKADALRSQLQSEFYTEYLKAKTDEEKEKMEEKYTEIQCQVMSEAILLDWKNVGQGDKEIPFSPKAAFDFLVDPAFTDLYQFIQRESIDGENFLAKNVEAITKDVKPSADS